ncbi:hypothetical protein [Bowmanella dokdonensis]|uniref:Uncharacterized protein n=1 Tax=Bowmanella dokdonensis TaxID=751969 RepID=A0A939DQL7_9ALTE|nr:hypothetical protein [Bowmanella dokdonensis]MBN7826106.1 hypothetical protein [Bowmanella dokdonensis]
MEIQTTGTALNKTFSTTAPATQSGGPPNAYGIGVANQPKVDLSPQARILQQTEQQQPVSQTGGRQQQNPGEKESAVEIQADFVRVSSSLGSAAQSNNLTSEKATELYRSIEKML